MRAKVLLLFLICAILISLSGVGQTQVIAPNPVNSQLPMEILAGLIGKYIAMMQQYEFLVAQGQMPDSAVSLKIAASIDISGISFNGEKIADPALVDISKLVFWVNANIFARELSTFAVDLSGSFGDIKILSKEDETILLSQDEGVFSVLPLASDNKAIIDMSLIDLTDVPMSIEELQQLTLTLLARLSNLNIEYEGLRPTPKGMAHVVKLAPIENDMILTLWILDRTWDLCKVELFDMQDGTLASILVDKIELVATVPDSEFEVDTSLLSEVPYDSLIGILGLKIIAVAFNGVPVVADLYVSSSRVLQGQQIEVISNAFDATDKESELIPLFECRSSNGLWTTLESQYIGTAPLGNWQAAFVPSIDEMVGSYDFRVSYTDKTGNVSEIFDLPNAVEVIAVPPSIVNTIPIDRSQNVLVSSSVVITFSQKMDVASMVSSSLTDASGNSVQGSFEWQGNSVTFKPSQKLNYSETYTVKVLGTVMGINGALLDGNRNGIADGSPTDDLTVRFTTEAIPTLTVVKTIPADRNRNILVSSSVVITFSQKMVEASVESGFSLTDASGNSVQGSFEWQDNSVTFKPSQKLNYSQIHIVKVLGTVMGINDALLDGNRNGVADGSPKDDLTVRFTTEAIPTLIAVKTIPADRDQNILASSAVVITFSQKMVEASVESGFSLNDASGNSVQGSFEWQDNSVTFKPSQKLNYSETYTAKVLGTVMGTNDALLDGNRNGVADGSPKDDLTVRFTTEAHPILTAIKTVPVDRDQKVLISSSVIITFSQKMDMASVESGFSLTDASGNPVQGSFEWLDNSVTFKPSQKLNYGLTYTVKILGTAMGDNGALLDGNKNGIADGSPKDDLTVRFTTEAHPILTVVKTIPADLEQNILISSTVVITFSQKMDEASVESGFSLTDASGNSIQGSFEWLRQGNSVTFKPSQNLNYGLTYTVKILGTAIGATGALLDGNGNGIAEGTPKDDFTIQFTAEAYPTLAINLHQSGKEIIKGDLFSVDIVAESISKLNSFTLELKYDPAILKIFKVKRTSFANWRPRPKEIGESDVWLPILIDNDKGTLTLAVSKTRDDGVSGTGVLATIIFDAVGTGESLISFQNVSLTNVLEKAIQPALREAKAVVRDFGLYDFNKDGVVDILDFIEMKPDGKADVNGDGVIDILDLVADMGPGRDLSIWDVNGDGVVDIQDFIIIRNENGADPDANGDGVVDILDIVYILNSIEASPNMEPKANGLGEIFPNPMNPEAWIPFKLASDSEVAIRIFNSRGQLVRKIDLGYKHLGSYVTRATAAYWDGMNENGEQVPSGIYFYNIKAGNFTATKKMVVMK